MKLRKFWSIGGAPGAPPLDPPLTSYWMFCELSWHTPSISCSFQENLTNSYGSTRFPPRDVPPHTHTFHHKVMFSQVSVYQRVGGTH